MPEATQHYFKKKPVEIQYFYLQVSSQFNTYGRKVTVQTGFFRYAFPEETRPKIIYLYKAPLSLRGKDLW